MMKKLEDWEKRFHRFLCENKDRKFRWGRWDCVIFANSACKAISGQKLIPEYLYWENKRTAVKTIKEYGETLLNSMIKGTKEKGLIEVPKDQIQKGDICVYDSKGKNITGVCDGYAIVSPASEGYGYNKMSKAIKVFRING